MLKYNYLGDYFTTYENNIEEPTKFDLPLMPDIDVSSWADGISDTGIPIAKNIVGFPTDLPTETEVYVEEPSDVLFINSEPVKGDKVPNYKWKEDKYIPISSPKSKKMKPIKTYSSSLNQRRERAFNFFLSKGLKDYLAAGLVGNLMQESMLDPNIKNSIGAYGLALWLGSRKKLLFLKYGNKPTFDLQLEFLWEELNSTEKSAFNHLLSTKTYEDAVKSVMNRFERPSLKEKDESISRRLKYASEFLS